MRERESIEQATIRYSRALHAMQTGVKFSLELLKSDEASQKHLRVGVNSAHVSTAALLGMLVKKGLLDGEEYQTALADEMEAEAKRYQAQLEKALGRPVTLL